MSSNSMFAPQWKFNQYDPFVVTTKIINEAVSEVVIDMDVKQKEGAVYDKCKESFKVIDGMLEKDDLS